MINRKSFQLTALIGIIVLVGAAAPAGAEPGDPEGLCPYLEVSAIEEVSLSRSTGFSVAQTSDLLFHIVFPEEFVQEHVVTLKFFTPGGHLYQTLDVPIAPALEGRGNSTRRLAGYPYPVRVRVPETISVRSNNVQAVQVVFPVGGTTIGSSSLFGEWLVKALIDGRPQRCVQPLVFELTE